MTGQKLREWTKKNYKDIVGLRPTRVVEVITEDNTQFWVGPAAFLFRKRGEKTFQVFGEAKRVHFPRSLGRRVRITINREGKIVAETDKCFGKHV